MLTRITQRLGFGVPSIVRSVHRERLSYLGLRALTDLHSFVATLEQQNAPGVLVEAGCALGGSAIVMASAKSPQRPFYVFDVFGMIPPPSERDGEDIHERYNTIQTGQANGIGGDRYYGYERDLRQKVEQNFCRHGLPLEGSNIHLVQGLFEDTLNVEQPIALAHLDGDWYESIMTCLTRLAPKLTLGGRLVIDDYEAWSGCKTAVDEYFAEKRDEFNFVRNARLHIVRKQTTAHVASSSAAATSSK